jgi:hypothetical protein
MAGESKGPFGRKTVALLVLLKGPQICEHEPVAFVGWKRFAMGEQSKKLGNGPVFGAKLRGLGPEIKSPG